MVPFFDVMMSWYEAVFLILRMQMYVKDEDDEEYGTKYLVQPIAQPEEDEGASDFEPGEDDEEEDEDFEDEDDEEHVEEPVGLKQDRKRMREETGEKEERPAKH